MLNIIKNSLRCSDYYVCLYKNYVYIFNYVSIDTFNSSLIKINLLDNSVVIKGTNLVIKKFIDNELLIQGSVKEISYE